MTSLTEAQVSESASACLQPDPIAWSACVICFCYSFASIGMRETVSDVETGEKCLGNSEY